MYLGSAFLAFEGFWKTLFWFSLFVKHTKNYMFSISLKKYKKNIKIKNKNTIYIYIYIYI